jgi:hypothetical protein
LTLPILGKLLLPISAPLLVKRMVPRMAFAGANDNNKPILERSFADLVEMLQLHLERRSYLFGGRPAFGDFGLWGQLYQAYTDPSCEVILNEYGPAVVAWILRMQNPALEGDFESLAALEPTLAPIFAREVGPHFLAWDVANARAWAAGSAKTELSMDGQRYYQKTFKYPVHTLGILVRKFTAAQGDAALQAFLQQTGCLQFLEDARDALQSPDR